MKVYFSASLRGKRVFKENYEKIHKLIEELGYKNVSEFVVEEDPEKFYPQDPEKQADIYDKLVSQIKKADVCVFEVSFHSLGLGYCVNLALELDKPVILLHVEERKPFLFEGAKEGKMQIIEYTKEDIKGKLSTALKEAKDQTNIRFTFFVTPKISRFLDWIAKEKKMPRAVYLRRLLKEAMDEEDFQG
jgi:glycosyltransferase involved in cell wall biosynthesis